MGLGNLRFGYRISLIGSLVSAQNAGCAAQYSLLDFCVKVGPDEPGEGAVVQQGQQLAGVATAAAASADIAFSQHLT